MKFIIDENNEGERLDLFLSELIPNISRSKIQASIKDGKAQVNSKKTKSSYILKGADIVCFELLQEESQKIQPEKIALNIVWEDENMAVVNKPSGMLTHPTTIEKTGTLVNALLYHYGENLSTLNGEMRRGIVHRLDRNTSGLIMIAKNDKTHEFLVNEMREKRFSKKYLAITRGVIEKDEFEINSPIGRHLTQPHKQSIREDGKESLTLVKVLNRFQDATLVELTLITGRTHQIRVHLSSIGHPVYNDTLYGFGKIKIKTEEQVLQSYKLEFTKPFTQERVLLEIPYDEKINKVLKALT
ncbi:RluA family pseudouridine synthase [bacterium]|nr:RluA family pseudouridine synthase [bacterium]